MTEAQQKRQSERGMVGVEDESNSLVETEEEEDGAFDKQEKRPRRRTEKRSSRRE